ncbi:MAG: SUMF1/EgtB/PvdO family nonheme iron enzyme [Planctomycetes bacterium]|nr:SUMF1/EgtB/PvdO family nonheme iron enzyme [Planctomycetota bacterium]
MATVAGIDELEEDAANPDHFPEYLAEIKTKSIQVIRGDQLTALERAEAGRNLSLLGDGRQEVLDSARMAFCKIPQGAFCLGEGDEGHECKELDYDYWLSMYPVTVSQFRQFSDAGGYGEKRYWPQAVQAEFWKEGKVKLRYDQDWRKSMPNLPNRFNYMNHPMVMISWFEGLAYCRWLTERFHRGEVVAKDLEGLDLQSWQVTLPSEAEWEKGARGCKDKRLYPFEHEIAPNLANYRETGIESTSAVGCFAGGASPYGCLDMAGNVWEWCRNTLEKYPYKRDDREDVSKNVGSFRVFRGGSWYGPAVRCRCSCRRRRNPGRRDVHLGFRVVLVPSSLSPAG